MSCKENSEKEAQVEETIEVNTTGQTVDPDKMQYADASLGKSAIDFESMDFEVDPQVREEVQAWEALNTFDATIEEVEAPEADIPTYGDRLVAEAKNLSTTIPQSLLTEEVEEDIKDINEEVADLKAILDEEVVDENKVNNQVEELVEAYDDLNEEINETIRKNAKKAQKEMKEPTDNMK